MERIAQIIDSLSVGGAERLQVTFAETAIANGVNPTIISLANYPGTPIPDQLRQTGSRLVEFTGRNLVDPVRFWKLVRFLRQEHFDVLHAHLPYAIILGALAGFLTNTPVIATLHNVKADHWGSLERIVLRLFVKRIIAVGNVVAVAYGSRVGKKRIDVLVNPVKSVSIPSAQQRNLMRAGIVKQPDQPVLASVGRLEAQKGFGDLIDAMAIVHRIHPDVSLLIVGKGSLHDLLLSQIQSLQLDEFIKLAGVRNDVPKLLAVCDLFVSASHWEGMPVSILEAMAAGLPVVATSVGDVPQLVKPDTGILVQPRQPQELANAICILLEDKHKRDTYGQTARDRTLREHSPQVWFEHLMNLYEETIASVHRGSDRDNGGV